MNPGNGPSDQVLSNFKLIHLPRPLEPISSSITTPQRCRQACRAIASTPETSTIRIPTEIATVVVVVMQSALVHQLRQILM